ncbi:hypothetical protein DRP77_09295, partial [Candidatus Poribacteria bacterium]
MAIDRLSRALEGRGELLRCLSSDLLTIYQRWDELPLPLRARFEGAFRRPGSKGSYWGAGPLPLTYTTPHFKFHYTLTGPDAVPPDDLSPKNGVPDYVEICAEAFERAYHILIDLAGFKPPLDDLFLADNGGDARYDVYLFRGNWLGFTAPDWFGRVISAAATAIPFFAINSGIYDYFGKSEGIRYLQTTSAHEFFHGVQFAYNISMPRWFMEACSTWVESLVYDGGRVDDGDDLPDPDEPGETDGYNYYADQLRYWFLHPDWSIERFDGWHEYGDVIWAIFLSERLGYEAIKRIFENTTWGTYRGMGNFSEALEPMGVNFASLFKEFAVWNYFTGERDDGNHYRFGRRFPPVAIHPQDVIRRYPARIYLPEGMMPEHMGSRYIELLPDGRTERLCIRVDASDLLNPRELRSHLVEGLYGWGVKLIPHRPDGSAGEMDLLLMPRSQQGQVEIEGFGDRVSRVTLVLVNLNPEVEYPGSYVSIHVGPPPPAKLSKPIVSPRVDGSVEISWEVLDPGGMEKAAVVRKRDDMGEGFPPSQALRGFDGDGDGIVDDSVELVGVVDASRTSFIDRTVFTDVDVESPYFSIESLRYWYAVVPISPNGIMGEPSISERWVAPNLPSKPILWLSVEVLSPTFWRLTLTSNLTIWETPVLICHPPAGELFEVRMRSEGERRWGGRIRFESPPRPGIYRFSVRNAEYAWMIGDEFEYGGFSLSKLYAAPNPAPRGGEIRFSRRDLDVEIYDLNGALIRRLRGASTWDLRNR